MKVKSPVKLLASNDKALSSITVADPVVKPNVLKSLLSVNNTVDAVILVVPSTFTAAVCDKAPATSNVRLPLRLDSSNTKPLISLISALPPLTASVLKLLSWVSVALVARISPLPVTMNAPVCVSAPPALSVKSVADRPATDRSFISRRWMLSATTSTVVKSLLAFCRSTV